MSQPKRSPLPGVLFSGHYPFATKSKHLLEFCLLGQYPLSTVLQDTPGWGCSAAKVLFCFLVSYQPIVLTCP